MNTQEYIKTHYTQYPKLELQDVMKFLFQSSFGCEHLVSNKESVKHYIEEEIKDNKDSLASYENLDGDFVRLHLNYGLHPDTLASLFTLSAIPQENGTKCLEEKLNILLDMIQNKELPFDYLQSKQALYDWKEKGYPAIHHSKTFNETYHPAYRLIHKKYVPFLPVFKYIDTYHPSLIAIDGRCASGKTTFASLLHKVYTCNIFHMDDFFLQEQQRTKERLCQPGENVDHERFEQEVLVPLKNGKDVSLQRFDCSTFTLQKSEHIPYTSLNVIEGSYSMHKALQKYYDYSIFLTLDSNEQIQRIKKRNPNRVNDFISQWIPLEEKYFNVCQVDKHCQICIDTSKA